MNRKTPWLPLVGCLLLGGLPGCDSSGSLGGESSEIADLSQRLDGLTEDLTALTVRVAATENEETAAQVAALSVRVDGLTGQLDALTARVEATEESCVHQVDGSASIPPSSTFGSEGGQIHLAAATNHSVGYTIDSFEDSLRVLEVDDAGERVVFHEHEPS
jgi:outer membrane murein-binding lipoprotein Lpp